MIDKFLSCISDPRVFSVNRLDAHCDRTDDCGERMLPLDGTWEFAYYPNVHALDDTVFSANTPAHSIEVPGHIELQGFGRPQYTNVAYPWDGHEPLTPPKIPSQNPDGVYGKSFTLPPDWTNRRVVLTLGGYEPSVFVVLNGAFVGYAEDGFTPAEFDLTALLHAGENRLVVLVPRFSTASWLNDQDFWRFSGLFRSVTLRALPDVSLFDAHLSAEPDDAFSSGTLTADVTLDSAVSSDAFVTLCCSGASVETRVAVLPGKQTVSLALTMDDIALWSAETPHLYDAEIRVTDRNGALLDCHAAAVGFRRFALNDGLMLLNGKRIVFRGVNRHEWNARRGRAITRSNMETDILLLKRNNFNAVRTSHYPNQSAFYALCDRYGLYVIDETNLETHGTWMLRSLGFNPVKQPLPGDDASFRDAVLERGKSMLMRDRNHPSVLIWSCGNESYGGKTLYELSQFFHAEDPGRLVHYEGVFHDRSYPDTSDMESRMYEQPKRIERYLRARPKKPFILCEYAHAMGNSFGNVDEYTALARKYPQYQGGFIWDWIDQGIDRRALPALFAQAAPADGRNAAFAVGGDFSDRPNDRYFCGDGLLFADRTPSPKLAEAKALYAPVSIMCGGNGVTVRNDRLFTSTGDLAFFWELTNDGAPVCSGTFMLDVPPGESRAFPLAPDLSGQSGECILSCAARLLSDAPYAPAGHEVAFGQSILRAPISRPRFGDGMPRGRLVRGLANIGVQMAHSSVLIDRRTGLIVSAAYEGTELLRSPILPDFWRAPTDNDIGCGAPYRWRKWKLASLYRLGTPALINERACRVCAWYISGSVCYRLTYTFYEDDAFEMALTVLPTPGDAPHAGFALTLPKSFHRMRWYGNTAREAASDRRNDLRIGRTESDVRDEYVPYLNPQDCANKTDLRYLSVLNDAGCGLTLSADAPFTASVLPWTSHELEAAENSDALPPVSKTVVSVAGRKCGVGGDDSWGARVHKPYLVSTGRGVRFSLFVRLTGPGAD